jgi:hypothetical protein
MKKLITVREEIEVNSKNQNLCDYKCKFLDGFSHTCSLFETALEIKKGNFIREFDCKKCE